MSAAAHGSAFRVAPGVRDVPAAFFWKFWIAANEIYASNRFGGHIVKFSFHFSGASHLQLGAGTRQPLPKPILLAGGKWMLALEVRFLLTEDAFRPPAETIKRKDHAYLVPVPPGMILVLDLLVTHKRETETPEIPPSLFERQTPVWASQLRAGHSVALMARVIPMDAENQERLDRIRKHHPPTVTYERQPARPPYREVRHVFPVVGGTFVFVIPMGAE